MKLSDVSIFKSIMANLKELHHFTEDQLYFFPEKKTNPNKNYSDVVLDHSYTRFPVLTEKFLAAKTWTACYTVGYIGYTNQSLSNKERFDNGCNFY